VGIFASKGVEKIAIPQVEQKLNQQLEKHKDDKENRETDRASLLLLPALRTAKTGLIAICDGRQAQLDERCSWPYFS
jgi:hypothetical protein